MKNKQQKLYCYVDETGQDAGSTVFIVVAIVNDQDQVKLRRKLLDIENRSKIGIRKWHKSKSENRCEFLSLILKEKIALGDVFVGEFIKPLPYFLPIIETLAFAIKKKAKIPYQTVIYIDGIDRKKARELTNALRLKHLCLEMIRGIRDESEPLIRLSDRWAGCWRASLNKGKNEYKLIKRGRKVKYFKEIG